MARTNLSELSDQQLVHEILGTERSLLRARFQHSQNLLENTTELGRLRKSIARLRTEVRTREIAGGMLKDSLLSLHSATFKAEAETGGAAAGGSFLSGLVDKLSSNE